MKTIFTFRGNKRELHKALMALVDNELIDRIAAEQDEFEVGAYKTRSNPNHLQMYVKLEQADHDPATLKK